MPRDRKRPERRQGHNTPDIGLIPAVDASKDAPQPQKGWLAVTKDRWEAFWRSSLAQIVERDSDLPALARLFSLYDELERAERAFRRKRFVSGSKGQPRLNPLAGHIAQLEPMIRALEDRFGLTPLSRLKLGIEFGNAHRSLDDLNRSFNADDRAEADPRLEVIEGVAAESG